MDSQKCEMMMGIKKRNDAKYGGNAGKAQSIQGI